MLTRGQPVRGMQRPSECAKHLNDKARKCRELADTAMTEDARSILFELAERYEAEAAMVDRPAKAPGYSEALV
jgi:hypothetical protein